MSLEHIQDAKEKQKDNEQQVRDLARRLGVQISCFNCADLCAKLAAANEELSAIDAAMDKVDLPTRQDDFALTRVGRLLSLQDWWKDYAECTQKAVERSEAAERERDAALAEARRYRSGIVKMKVLCRDGIRRAVEVHNSFKPGPHDPLDYTIGEKDTAGQAFIRAADGSWMWGNCWQVAVFEAAQLLRSERDAAQAEIAGLRKALAFYADKASWDKGNWFNDWPAVIDRGSKARAALATPSTAGESLRPTMAEAVAAVRQAEQNLAEHQKAVERVCEAGRQYRKVFWNWEEGSRWYNEMMRALDALAALEGNHVQE